ncbi:hypothetical protein WOLCODRAFT_29550 [Wolfiporia cocos MD-104 SS10]|uniref:Uncharacterized protein n=1 Tax=Wolfiporia cocos (strain MD-104) TaxID=742152 RepID=A0A2H3JTI0_WOLCO|nr:hypothetical protein WOLCODRAFT_29550 [Wolfiporia cocos MD-104 SS10]
MSVSGKLASMVLSATGSVVSPPPSVSGSVSMLSVECPSYVVHRDGVTRMMWVSPRRRRRPLTDVVWHDILLGNLT